MAVDTPRLHLQDQWADLAHLLDLALAAEAASAAVSGVASEVVVEVEDSAAIAEATGTVVEVGMEAVEEVLSAIRTASRRRVRLLALVVVVGVATAVVATVTETPAGVATVTEILAGVVMAVEAGTMIAHPGMAEVAV